MNAYVEEYMIKSMDKQYHDNFRKFYKLVSGYYGYNITTNFNDNEKLKLVKYLAIHG